jgi:hypothetical protein
MKLTRVFLLAVIFLLGVHSTGSAKNFIYKGSVTTLDLVSGKSAVAALYFVFGNETPLAGSPSNYTEVSASLVVFLRLEGAKRYLTGDAGKFRSLKIETTKNGKPRIVETFTQSTGQTDIEFISLGAILLSGVQTKPFYDTPPILTGESLTSNAAREGDVATGGALIRKFKLTLDRVLTDPIPADETLADSVKRVTAALEKKGYIEFIP